MAKKIIIEYCTSCPFMKGEPNHNSDNTYFISCGHEDAPEHEKVETKISNRYSIPHFCPLEELDTE